ncbi:MAG TPA: hypothetical protein VNC18_00840 [Gemmatimonadaceae bacterium]|jgi:hypothetical protein|nr:hypothetical protein [Gemmatimonadaceae bacterium]
MSLTRMAAAAFVVMALPLTLGAQPDSSKSAPPPRSPEQLADRYRRAHAAHNVQAIKGLFYWGASTDRTRTLVGSFIEQDVSNAVRQVSVVGLDSSDRFRYTQDGVAFRTTLPPTAKLRIDFLPRSARGGTYKSEQTYYFIGARNGDFWLLTAEPVPSGSPGTKETRK